VFHLMSVYDDVEIYRMRCSALGNLFLILEMGIRLSVKFRPAVRSNWPTTFT